jgi:hypothetical protein
MGRDTPLGKRKNHVEGERKKSLMVRSTGFSGHLVESRRFSVLFSMPRTYGFSRCTLRECPPHLCAHILFFAYFGVPDAGRDGVWIPAQTNADRTSAVTG